MTKAAIRFISWHFVIILIVVAFVFACATLPPTKPIRDLKSIAGKWEGLIYYPSGVDPYTLTIRQDGTWESIVPPKSNLASRIGAHAVGTGKLSEGKYQFKSQTTGSTGLYILHEEGGRRVLVITTDDGKVRAEVTPAKK